MPYIDAASKIECEKNGPATAGQLNYKITMLLIEYFNTWGSYQSINDVLGALEGAKMEFYRRIAVPYEDKKIKQNGDVY